MNKTTHVKECTFGIAILALADGKRATRREWNDLDNFVFMQIPSEIDANIVPKMQSLPQSAKDEFVRRFADESYQINKIYYRNQLAIVDKSNRISGWSPSVEDSLSEDWLIFR